MSKSPTILEISPTATTLWKERLNNCKDIWRRRRQRRQRWSRRYLHTRMKTMEWIQTSMKQTNILLVFKQKYQMRKMNSIIYRKISRRGQRHQTNTKVNLFTIKKVRKLKWCETTISPNSSIKQKTRFDSRIIKWLTPRKNLSKYQLITIS